MRSLFPFILFVIFSFHVFGQTVSENLQNISYQGILSGKYHSYLSENQEYLNKKAAYQFALKEYEYAQSRLDSLRKLIDKSSLTSYVRMNTQEILNQAGNQVTGDVYISLRTKGMDFALVLNDIVPLSELYHYDRIVVQSKLEIDKAIEWSKSLAEVSLYFKHLFKEKKLIQPVDVYNQLKDVDKQIETALKEYRKNGNRLTENQGKYQSLYNIWQNYEEELRYGKDRVSFYNMLEKKYGKIINKAAE
ncbi:hypothetical protein [Chondrinema litorale]|uniref:hypothetical protein n=1 Tax=Chondrinema litorale TaxID=2994555 RepID=UPI0025427D8B|nr:hypothetical protein [Chondrinema litorale]UZR94579.1 hypothetical protein OQ292_01940 [Chondrinema litorale]